MIDNLPKPFDTLEKTTLPFLSASKESFSLELQKFVIFLEFWLSYLIYILDKERRPAWEAPIIYLVCRFGKPVGLFRHAFLYHSR